MTEASPAIDGLAGLRRFALLMAAAGISITLGGLLLDPTQFFRSYLVAWLFWLAVTLGCWAWTMLHNLTGGAWGAATRPVLESAALTLPLLPLLFLPIVAGLPELYPWARPEEVRADPLLMHKQPYLNVPFFLARAAGYFVLWLGFAWLVRRQEAAARHSRDPDAGARLRRASGLGLLTYGLTMTFASIDWGMSLEPHWFSAVYGVIFFIGHGLTGLAFAIAVTAAVNRPIPNAGLSGETAIDLGNLLLAFIMLWTYVSFSQLLIIWYSDLPEEVPWYLRRSSHGWQLTGVALATLGFAAPFLALLSRRLKQSAEALAALAGALLVVRWIEVVWLIEPAFERDRLYVPWLDLAATAAIGGVWLAFFTRHLSRHAGWPPRALPVSEEERR